EESSEAQRALLGLIANAEEAALPEEKIMAQLSSGFDPQEIRAALRYFLRRDVLIEREGGHAFRAPLLKTWVRQQTR
ncbi:MAG TPA: hypothetical protein G4O05_05945, partial [Caldilineae bacterium]|nr:hypothetical protein [Caldilineae bacterium]